MTYSSDEQVVRAFDEQFTEVVADTPRVVRRLPQGVYDFILSQRKKDREAVVELVKTMKRVEFVGDIFEQMGLPSVQKSVEDFLQIDKARSYNQALSDIIKSIQNL